MLITTMFANLKIKYFSILNLSKDTRNFSGCFNELHVVFVHVLLESLGSFIGENLNLRFVSLQLRTAHTDLGDFFDIYTTNTRN